VSRQSNSETRAALAELSDAATAFLRAEADGLLRLVRARDRANELLGERRTVQRAACSCGAASGFHASSCALVPAGAE
jgi:hypothetical protein